MNMNNVIGWDSVSHIDVLGSGKSIWGYNSDRDVATVTSVVKLAEVIGALVQSVITTVENITTNNVCCMIAAMVAAYPNRVAISDGDYHLTYRQLHHLAVINSRELRKLREGSAVLLLNRREIDTYVGMLSILYASCFYSPLKADWPKERYPDRWLLEPSLIVELKEGVEKLYSEIPK